MQNANIQPQLCRPTISLQVQSVLTVLRAHRVVFCGTLVEKCGHITVCMALLVCVLSIVSQCIHWAIPTSSRFLLIETCFLIAIHIHCSSIVVSSSAHTPVDIIFCHCVGRYMFNDNGVQHGSTLLRDRWKTLNVDFCFKLSKKNHHWLCLMVVLTVSLFVLRRL